ncbi:MAG: LPS export ABC transporter periplasmic protein LptC [Nitrospinae bacterium RIFCSPLOWO2_02_FULL_39_110]|nr:MAG: LPS export ABC transporter periplasmic protein LptC [Nitrospinae bacterium RIFCSPHIGHO2_02_39_11]OGV98198.1 MAG: LPS export ABC transporter periplasmic protein LptC [Nitrospinae bacterium RIFCSPHIGHO2_12_FULL_39_42]OGV99661.1 MAG: LPS export ABC transporter periplasmic protein LptC [Nitrospinae bacterium RIFCSPHIGHO2_02_FULL_39_82]OGW01506.1 MAG: LPS export ABC transporter periplasmic protein LptC [Nitrospinae bacterium RIFCSPLOWO2_02_39_17]OGW03817.1 MAG: LPS export ABC transporter per
MKGIKILRWFLIIIILSVTSLTIFYLLEGQPIKDNSAAINIAKRGIDLIMRRVRLEEKRGGNREWELVAKMAEFDKSKNKINLEDIKAIFYPADRKPITVSSKKGIMDNKSKNIELSGNVFIKSDDGYKLNTENLKWVASRRVLETDDFIEITGERFKITGNGLVSNIDSQDIKIKSNVEAIYY